MSRKEYHREYYRNRSKLDRKWLEGKYRVAKDRKRETQLKVNEIKQSSGCVDCGENEPVCLDFDHIDPSAKFKPVSKMVANGCSWARIEAEIEKCAVRCANCHRKKTAADFQWFE